MRWGYKTVQYGLKKEGLLGGAFLDEAEVEQSLNEFGQAGWELVSLFGMQDGLMAVFKQPIGIQVERVQEPVSKEPSSPHRFSLSSREGHGAEQVIEDKIGGREPGVSLIVEDGKEEGGVGAIRIE